MTTEVKCTQCGLLIDSTTVVAKHYKEGDIVDMGCPYCGPTIALAATSTKEKRRKKKDIMDEPDIFLSSPKEEDTEESE